MTAGDELVEVVDEAGAVVRLATRAEMRAGNLRHRGVAVVVITGAGELVAHRRADWKDVWPGRWDCSFGGVVAAGEDVAAAAARELAEEAGVAGVPLEHLGRGVHDDDEVREVGDVYLARWDGAVDPTDGEVVEVGSVAVAALDAWLATHEVVPDARSIVVPLLRPASGGQGSTP